MPALSARREWTQARSKHFHCTNKNMNLSSMTVLPGSSGLAQLSPVSTRCPRAHGSPAELEHKECESQETKKKKKQGHQREVPLRDTEAAARPFISQMSSTAVLRLLTTRWHSKAHQGQSGAGAVWEGLHTKDRSLASGLKVICE